MLNNIYCKILHTVESISNHPDIPNHYRSLHDTRVEDSEENQSQKTQFEASLEGMTEVVSEEVLVLVWQRATSTF